MKSSAQLGQRSRLVSPEVARKLVKCGAAGDEKLCDVAGRLFGMPPDIFQCLTQQCHAKGQLRLMHRAAPAPWFSRPA